MLQEILVALIVAVAAGYSFWKLAPGALRHALAARSGRVARATGASEQLARRIEITATHAAANAGGCGSCGPCKACATGKAQAANDDAPAPPAT